MKQDQTARDIVINLLRRYRLARHVVHLTRGADRNLVLINQSHMIEARNAYISSKKILLGLEP